MSVSEARPEASSAETVARHAPGRRGRAGPACPSRPEALSGERREPGPACATAVWRRVRVGLSGERRVLPELRVRHDTSRPERRALRALGRRRRAGGGSRLGLSGERRGGRAPAGRPGPRVSVSA